LVGAFWGVLFELIFIVPPLGLALGAGLGALTASLANIGIDDGFINQVRREVTPGTSTLFLYTQDVHEGVLDEFKAVAGHPVLILSSLSKEQEARLLEAFGEDSPTAAA
jgi:uncharacterized membrane protein